jgi:hypothetical protein
MSAPDSREPDIEALRRSFLRGELFVVREVSQEIHDELADIADSLKLQPDDSPADPSP